jgi:alpha/beta hydrolase fold
VNRKGLSLMPSDPTDPAFVHGMAGVSPGVRLHYATLGDGERIVVLLHGFPQTWREWRQVMPALAKAGYRVVAPDYRGAGDSSRPAGGYDKRTMAIDIHQLFRDEVSHLVRPRCAVARYRGVRPPSDRSEGLAFCVPRGPGYSGDADRRTGTPVAAGVLQRTDLQSRCDRRPRPRRVRLRLLRAGRAARRTRAVPGIRPGCR